MIRSFPHYSTSKCETKHHGDTIMYLQINMQSQNEYSYLDEDPQEIRPYEFEVPILHMAIIDVSGILIK